MLRFSLLCLVVISLSLPAFPQIASQAVTSPPIAYVYVANTANQIVGYSASSTGKLTSIPGSPFKGAGGASMAVNGKYLFGEGTANIYSYLIASNGALKQVASFNAI